MLGCDSVVCSRGWPRDAPPTCHADPRVCLRSLVAQHGVREQALDEACCGSQLGGRWAANAASKVQEDLGSQSHDQKVATFAGQQLGTGARGCLAAGPVCGCRRAIADYDETGALQRRFHDDMMCYHWPSHGAVPRGCMLQMG